MLAATRAPVVTRLALLFGLTCMRCVAVESTLPAEVSFLSDLMRLQARYELWNEIPFPRHGGKPYSGKHWGIQGRISGAADAVSAWKKLKDAFTAKGWTVETDFSDPSHRFATLHFTKNGVEAWANIEILPPDDVRIDLLEPSPLPYLLALPVPKSRPEPIDAAKGDFPYATPLSGSKLINSKADSAPFLITAGGAIQPQVISIGSIIKTYSHPENLSGPLFAVEYRTGLAKAGWEIVNESTGPDASIVAHYGKGRRNLWASLHWNHDSYQIQVAEARENLARALSANCHVALYGLLFDFNESIIDPSSWPTLGPSDSAGTPGEVLTYTATTTSSVPGSFHWELGKQKDTDDPTAFTLTASSCAGETSCTAKVRIDQPGFVDVGVSFLPANTTQIMQAESAAVLRQVLALLKKNPRMHLEVQGYTDDTGTDAYNQMLSESQAAAVVAWLTQNGIGPKRLTSKGYGKARPVADNGSNQGKAMNHRIEIVDSGCAPKGSGRIDSR